MVAFEMKWISVKDSLPRNFEEVLAYKNKTIIHAFFDDAEDWYWVNCPRMINNVTHWMPLPEPPEDMII